MLHHTFFIKRSAAMFHNLVMAEVHRTQAKEFVFEEEVLECSTDFLAAFFALYSCMNLLISFLSLSVKGLL